MRAQFFAQVMITIVITGFYTTVVAGPQCLLVFTVSSESEKSTPGLSYEEILATSQTEHLFREHLGSLALYIEAKVVGQKHVYDLEKIDFTRIRAPQIVSESTIVLHSDASVRERVLSPWRRETVELPAVQIEKVSPLEVLPTWYEVSEFNKRELDDLTEYQLGTVQGQTVMVSRPLATDSVGSPLYNESLYILAHLQAHGAIPFAMVGRDPSGQYRYVVPLHAPTAPGHERSLQEMIAIDQLLDRLKTSTLPSLNQSIDIATYEHLSYDIHHFLTVSVGPEGKLFISSIASVERKPILNEDDGFFNYFGYESKPDAAFGILTLARVSLSNQAPDPVPYFNYLLEKGRTELILQLLYLHEITSADERGAYWSPLHQKLGIRLSEQISIPVTGWCTAACLRKHSVKHGAKELELSAADYEQLSYEFFTSSDGPAIVINRRVSNTLLKYNFRTGEFGIIDSTGKIITYYFIDPARRPNEDITTYLGENVFNR